MKKLIIGCLAAQAVVFAAFARDAEFAKAPYMDAKLPYEERCRDLISRMTIAEKVAVLSTKPGFGMYEIVDGEVRPSAYLRELYAKFPGCGLMSTFRADWFSGRNWKTGLTPDLLIKAYNALQRFAVEETRLGIPLGLDGGHMLGETTIPSGLGCASMWDLDAIRAGTEVRLRERRTFTKFFGDGHPTCDLALDPHWSRVEQTFGEDPFLSAEINYVRCKTASSMGGAMHIAHMCGHGCSENGRMNRPTHMGQNEMYNVHMRPFIYAVRGGCDNIMTCYNMIDGVPGSLRGDLVNGFVRGKLGYKGFFMTDAGVIESFVSDGFARDLGTAATLVVRNGNDMCCWEAENYLNGLSMAIARGELKESELDRSLTIVLMQRFERGLFENPYIDAAWTAKYGRPEDVIDSRANRDVVLDMARKSMTLLENPKGVLPLDVKKVRRLAVIGPNHDKPTNQIGDYTAPQRPGQTITPKLAFEAMGRRYGFEVVSALGCRIRSMNRDGFADAIAAAKSADAVVLCLGGSSVPDMDLAQNKAGTAIATAAQEDSELDKDTGEGFERAVLRLGGVQNELLAELRKTGKPIVTVLIMGRPIVMDEVKANSDAVLLAWYPGTEGGTAIAETVFGFNNPGGKLPVSFPRHEGALPCYYHALMPRGNYVDMPADPAYAFGYGLSYTTFKVSRPVVTGNKVTAEVTNTGKVKGDDVVQMYIHDALFTVARPVWELKGFKRVTLAPGETKTVTFELTEKELGYFNRDLDYVVEPGDFYIEVDDRFDEHLFRRRSLASGAKPVVYTVQ